MEISRLCVRTLVLFVTTLVTVCVCACVCMCVCVRVHLRCDPRYLDLGYNRFSSTVPAEWTNFTTLAYLSAPNSSGPQTQLSVVSALTALTYLDLSRSNIRGSLTSLGPLSRLMYVDWQWIFSRVCVCA